MAGIPLPKPISVTQFQPDPHAQTFTQIFNDTMGNLGTDSDGMDSLLADLKMAQPPGGASDTTIGNAVAAIAGVRSAIPKGAGSHFKLDFQSALDAGRTKYNTFAGTVGPDGQPIGSAGPVGGGGTTPTPTPTTVCTVPPDNPAEVLPNMTVGDTPYEEVLSQYDTPIDPIIRDRMICGDRSIFQIKKVTSPGGYGGSVGVITTVKLVLVVTPTKPGTFTGGYRETQQDTGDITDSYVTVTIMPKSIRPVPIGPGHGGRVV